jgi:hypothetical protein
MRGPGSCFGGAALVLVLAIAGGAAAKPSARRATDFAGPPSFSEEEREALLSGGVVPRPMRFEHAGGRYVGGVSYQVVNAPPAVVFASLSSVSSLPEILPNTHRARRISGSDSITRVELTQGNSIVRATYTVCLVADPVGTQLRFWLDRNQPHDIHDAWGYFRAQEFGLGRSLITVAAALDLGPGLGRLLFEDVVQTVALSTPHHIREFVEPRYLALR